MVSNSLYSPGGPCQFSVSHMLKKTHFSLEKDKEKDTLHPITKLHRTCSQDGMVPDTKSVSSIETQKQTYANLLK